MTVQFYIPGKPLGKQRPKFNSKTHTTYTPEQTVTYENIVKLEYQVQTRGQKLIGAIKAEITAFYPIVKSVSKKDRASMESGMILPTKKPDTDNIAKIVLDSLNGIAYDDDSQIVSLLVIKKYADKPQVTVRMEEIQ
jgi:Holliday junction resolvase RusA-like endonuclease